MSEILLLNPRRKVRKKSRKVGAKKRNKKRTFKKNPAKKTAAKKGEYPMAKRRRRQTIKRRAPKRNPSPRVRRVAKTVSKRAFGSLNFRTALKNIPISTIGMFAAKWAAKRFGQAATETDPESWNYASYLKGAGGAAAMGIIANMLKPGTGQKVLEGGMSLMLYKLVENEFISKSTGFWNDQLGQTREPGVIEENSAGEPYILGADYQWYPLEENSRMQGGYGEALVAPGPLGDALVQPGPLGSDLDQLYVNSFLRR